MILKEKNNRKGEKCAMASRRSDQDSKKWLDAFSDPLASLYTFTTCMALADLQGDGDHKLLIADLGTGKYSMRLKVYKGVTLILEQALVDLPTALVPFFMDQIEPRVPAVAVASGPAVYIYRNLKPYYKFSLPSMPINVTEKEVWAQVSEEKLETAVLTEVLQGLNTQITFGQLTQRSQRYLLLKDDIDRNEFIDSQKDVPLKKQSCVTCLASIKKSSIEKDSIDCLIVGAENGKIYFFGTEAFTILSEATVPSAPVFLNTSGLYDVEYRVLVGCRDGKIYTLKRGITDVERATIELNSHAVGMCKVGKNIVVGCMDKTLRSYSLKGRRSWNLKMPASITAVQCLEYTPKQYLAALVALDNKQLHIYQDVFLVDVLNLDDVATGIHFGRFGREEGALILTQRGGGLNVKLFKRTARLEEKAAVVGPNPAQTTKLNIPKKTKIFVDQTLREREDAIRMHEIFQRDLFMLRLETAEAYSKMLDTNMTPVNWDPDHMLKLSAAVQGFGPNFLLKMYVQTSSVQAVTQLMLTFQYNPRLYTLESNIIHMPMLVPGIQYSFQTKVTCVMADKGVSDDIRVLVAREGDTNPVLTAIVTMPISEQTLLD